VFSYFHFLVVVELRFLMDGSAARSREVQARRNSGVLGKSKRTRKPCEQGAAR
jgi:hypothetical protein